MPLPAGPWLLRPAMRTIFLSFFAGGAAATCDRAARTRDRRRTVELRSMGRPYGGEVGGCFTPRRSLRELGPPGSSALPPAPIHFISPPGSPPVQVSLAACTCQSPLRLAFLRFS